MSKLGNFFIYSPILLKFGMKVCCGTLMTGKILRSGFHDNGCQGDQKTFSQLKNITYQRGIFNEKSSVGWGKDCEVPVTMKTKFVTMAIIKGSLVDQFGILKLKPRALGYSACWFGKG